MTLTERFLHYVTFDTRSDDNSSAMPSTAGQRVLAQALADELAGIGMADVQLDDNGYLTATLPANTSEAIPAIGFIAHLDTSPEVSGANVHPRIVSYAGGDIVLNEAEGIVLSPALFPELSDYVGQDIVVTDGNTLLGADDKAGIAAIVSAMDYLLHHPEIAHGALRIAFTPDEEIGRGTDRFDVKAFGCAFAYTVDGGRLGELEYENFNAAAATLTFSGLNVHPGAAKGKMVNAAQLAADFAASLPAGERPEMTEGDEGFYHLVSLCGTVGTATLSCIIRDYSRPRFEARKQRLRRMVGAVNKAHPNAVTLKMRNQYYNMRQVIEQQPHIVVLAAEAMQQAGVEPLIRSIRGGTDGARLSFMGLPCPNLFAGGHNFHGRYEFLPLPSLQKSTETIIHIAALWAAKSR
jgi:tripeptide aminopeptidase